MAKRLPAHTRDVRGAQGWVIFQHLHYQLPELSLRVEGHVSLRRSDGRPRAVLGSRVHRWDSREFHSWTTLMISCIEALVAAIVSRLTQLLFEAKTVFLYHCESRHGSECRG